MPDVGGHVGPHPACRVAAQPGLTAGLLSVGSPQPDVQQV